jgi:MFS family permease
VASASAVEAEPAFNPRSLIASVYLPTFLFSVGQGAVIPAVPLLAVNLGASAALASLIVGMRGIGTLALDVPGGILESKLGDKFVMVAGTGLVALVAIGASFSTSPLQLALLMLVMGGGWSFWLLARLAYVSEAVPAHQRGRVLSVVGGTNRIGNFVGPLVGGSTLSAHRRIFATAGFAVIMLQLLRQARQVFLPLWGKSIGLDIQEISLVFSFSTAIDMLLFYPAGNVMDRWGRKWVAVPSLLVLSASVAMIPLAHGFALLAVVGLLAGFGNGIGAGLAMTLGADFAPPETRGEFLGMWRFVGDVGTAGGPLLIGLLAGIATLGAASVTVACFGLAGALLLMRLVPEPLRRSPPVTAVE